MAEPEGAASIRLDRSGPLGAVDTDGAVMILSGPLSDGRAPSLSLDGEALPDPELAADLGLASAPAALTPRTLLTALRLAAGLDRSRYEPVVLVHGEGGRVARFEKRYGKKK